jgi:hypothetical protein
LSAPIPGPKRYIFRETQDGIGIDESPQASLTYNASNFSLYETILWKKGAHRNFGEEANYDLEMHLYFRDIYDYGKQVAVAIPIMIDDQNASSNPAVYNYFTELTNQDSNVRKQPLENLIRDGPVLTYKGMDMRQRNSINTFKAPYCDNPNAYITWFILPSTVISSYYANKIRSIEHPCNKNPATPTHELTLERARSMTMIIPKIETQTAVDARKSAEAAKSESSKGIYLTRALQCQRINPVTDIRKDKVYLPNVKGSSTLKDELDVVATLDQPLDELPDDEAGRRAKQIEDLLALIVGISIGVVVFGFIAYYLLNNIFKNYAKTINMNEAIIAAAEEATKK